MSAGEGKVLLEPKRHGDPWGEAELPEGRRTALIPVTAEHFDFLYRLTIDEEAGPRWWGRGAVPDAKQFANDLWKGTFCQFVLLTSSGIPIGHVVAYDADMINGWAYIGGAFVSQVRNRLFAIDGFYAFVDYLFSNWNFRKLYMELPEYNLGQVESQLDNIAKVEARLKQDVYFGCRYCDRLIVALYRDDFTMPGRFTVGSSGRNPFAPPD